MTSFNYTPIGYYQSSKLNPYEAARQSSRKSTHQGKIVLNKGQNYEQALDQLAGFNYIWLIYDFHHNKNWKPKVTPPRTLPRGPKKMGVFATRSPYRPNPIGLSCVKLVKINNLTLTIEGADLLNDTPILDIKPYLAYVDSIPKAKTGWLKNIEKYRFLIKFSRKAKKQILWLKNHQVGEVEDFIRIHLEYEPTNTKKKRITKDKTHFIIAYRTWRIRYKIINKTITILDIFSGYSQHELNGADDIYGDKNTHQEFNKEFHSSF